MRRRGTKRKDVGAKLARSSREPRASRSPEPSAGALRPRRPPPRVQPARRPTTRRRARGRLLDRRRRRRSGPRRRSSTSAAVDSGADAVGRTRRGRGVATDAADEAAHARRGMASVAAGPAGGGRLEGYKGARRAAADDGGSARRGLADRVDRGPRPTDARGPRADASARRGAPRRARGADRRRRRRREGDARRGPVAAAQRPARSSCLVDLAVGGAGPRDGRGRGGWGDQPARRWRRARADEA